MEKLTWKEFVNKMREANKNQEKLSGVIVFSPESFDKEFSEESRSYLVSSDDKYFTLGMIGNSLFGNCLDGSEDGVRLDLYMKALPEDELGKRWIVDYCYISDENSNAEPTDTKLEEDITNNIPNSADYISDPDENDIIYFEDIQKMTSEERWNLWVVNHGGDDSIQSEKDYESNFWGWAESNFTSKESDEPVIVKFWETDVDRDEGLSEIYKTYPADKESIKKAIEDAKHIMHLMDYASIEVYNEDTEVTYYWTDGVTEEYLEKHEESKIIESKTGELTKWLEYVNDHFTTAQNVDELLDAYIKNNSITDESVISELRSYINANRAELNKKFHFVDLDNDPGFKAYVRSLLKDGAIDDPAYVNKLSDEEFEDLLTNTWMKDPEIIDTYKSLNESQVRDAADAIHNDDRYEGKEMESINSMLAKKIADIAEDMGDDYSEWLGKNEILEIVDEVVVSDMWRGIETEIDTVLRKVIEDKVDWIRRDEPASKYYGREDLEESKSNKYDDDYRGNDYWELNDMYNEEGSISKEDLLDELKNRYATQNGIKKAFEEITGERLEESKGIDSSDNIVDKIMKYFDDNGFYMDEFGEDQMSEMYANILTELGIKYNSIETESISDGKYETIVETDKGNYGIDTKAYWNKEEFIENFKDFLGELKEIKNEDYTQASNNKPMSFEDWKESNLFIPALLKYYDVTTEEELSDCNISENDTVEIYNEYVSNLGKDKSDYYYYELHFDFTEESGKDSDGYSKFFKSKEDVEDDIDEIWNLAIAEDVIGDEDDYYDIDYAQKIDKHEYEDATGNKLNEDYTQASNAGAIKVDIMGQTKKKSKKDKEDPALKSLPVQQVLIEDKDLKCEDDTENGSKYVTYQGYTFIPVGNVKSNRDTFNMLNRNRKLDSIFSKENGTFNYTEFYKLSPEYDLFRIPELDNIIVIPTTNGLFEYTGNQSTYRTPDKLKSDDQLRKTNKAGYIGYREDKDIIRDILKDSMDYKDIARKYGYGFNPHQLYNIATLYANTDSSDVKTKIEDLLTDINYHSECSEIKEDPIKYRDTLFESKETHKSDYTELEEAIEKDIYRWLIDNYELDLKDEQDQKYDLESYIDEFTSQRLINYEEANDVELIWYFTVDIKRPFGIKVTIEEA